MERFAILRWHNRGVERWIVSHLVFPANRLASQERSLPVKTQGTYGQTSGVLSVKSDQKCAFFENVSNLLRLGFEEIADDLRAMGYAVKAGLFTAEEVGATHKRERLFILAYTDSIRCDSGRDNWEGRHLQADLDRHSTQDQQKRQRRVIRSGKDCEDVEDIL